MEIKAITQDEALAIAKSPGQLLGLFYVQAPKDPAYEIGIDNRQGKAIVRTGTKGEVMQWLRSRKRCTFTGI